MSLEDNMSTKSPNRNALTRKGVSPIRANAGPSHAQGVVTDLENKLIDVQRENKELLKEIKLLQRIQDR